MSTGPQEGDQAPETGRRISVVVPLLNEEATLEELHRQLLAVAQTEGYDLQIVFVDDGSTDRSGRSSARSRASAPDRGGPLPTQLRQGGRAERRFRRGDGADHHHDGRRPAGRPGRTPQAARQARPQRRGRGVRRRERLEGRPPGPVAQTVALARVQLAGQPPDEGPAARPQLRPQGVPREALDEVRLYGELHRFVPVLAAARGYRVAEVGVHHRAREHGHSKYGASRIVKGLLDLITVKFLTGYGDRPQHLLGGVGLLGFLAGGLGLVYLAVRWIVSRVVPGLEPLHLHETAALFYSLALCLVGSQFLSVGLLGAMITALLTRDEPGYSIVERTAATRRTHERIPPNPPAENGLSAGTRWLIYTVLIAVALGQAAGKILAINAVDLARLERGRVRAALAKERTTLERQGVTGDAPRTALEAAEERITREQRLQRPFLSGNDRSRWMAIRAIAENGDHHIEPFFEERTWDTIDMVQHAGRDGELHLYSSKPPLLMVLLSGPYWVLTKATGLTLGEAPYLLGRIMLLLFNGGALAALLVCVARLIERVGFGDVDRLFAMAAAACGTQLAAFAPVLNNHLFAAAAAAVRLRRLAPLARFRRRGQRSLTASRPRRRLGDRVRIARAVAGRPDRSFALHEAPRRDAPRLRRRLRGRGGRLLRHELLGAQQPAAPLRPPERDRPGGQLVRLRVHRQRQDARQLLAQPPRDRRGRGVQSDLRLSTRWSATTASSRSRPSGC